MSKECAVCKKPAQLAAVITKGEQRANVYLCESCARRISEKMPVTVIASGVSSLPKGTVLSPNKSVHTTGQPVHQQAVEVTVQPRENQTEQAPDHPKPMFCGTCGAKLQPGARFCLSCGTPAGTYSAPKSSQTVQADSTAQLQRQVSQPAPTPTPIAVPVPTVNVHQAGPVSKNTKKHKKGGGRAFISLVVVIGLIAVFAHAAKNAPDRASDSTDRTVRTSDPIPAGTADEEKTVETTAVPDTSTENVSSESGESASAADSTITEDAQQLVNDVNSLLSGLGDILSSAADDAKEAVSSSTDGTTSEIANALIDEAVDYVAEKTDLVIRPEYKEAIDSYEAFFDEYIDFMTVYSESENPLSLLSEYLEYMTKLSDCMEKFDALEDDAANTAETAYYLEAQLRITQKLLSVSNSNP